MGQIAHQARGLKKKPRISPAESDRTQRTQNTSPTAGRVPPERARLPITQNIMAPQRSLLNWMESSNLGRALRLLFPRMIYPNAFPLGQRVEQKDLGFLSVITMAAAMSPARAKPSSGTKIPPVAMKKTKTLDAISKTLFR